MSGDTRIAPSGPTVPSERTHASSPGRLAIRTLAITVPVGAVVTVVALLSRAPVGEIANLLGGVASAVTALVAGVALQMWREQVAVTHNFQLALRVMNAMYEVQDAVGRVHVLVSRRHADPKGDFTWGPVEEAFDRYCA